jgi:hypothetical protein
MLSFRSLSLRNTCLVTILFTEMRLFMGYSLYLRRCSEHDSFTTCRIFTDAITTEEQSCCPLPSLLVTVRRFFKHGGPGELARYFF